MKIGEHKIESAEEFVRLRLSEDPAEYSRSSYDWAEDAVWHDVLDRFPDMARWFVHNKSVPLAILDRLIDAGDPETLRWTMNKRKLSREQFERLARYPDGHIRQSIAGNAKIPQDLLETLQKDPNHWVRRSAYQALTERKQKKAKATQRHSALQNL